MPEAAPKPVSANATDDIDWDRVHENYSGTVLGPWAPVMTAQDASGQSRNQLLNALGRIDLHGKKILDLGCGVGFLAQHLKGRTERIYGLDISATALSLAQGRAAQAGIEFIALQSDMSTYVDPDGYDLIISSNSILPRERRFVHEALARICDNLRPDGRFMAVMPSFDTCEYLLACLEDTYRAEPGATAEMVSEKIAAFKRIKQFDPAALSFADDNLHPQCFHTPESLTQELRAAGLEMAAAPTKVYYPWEYTREFGYGDFPGREEIWDWYIEAGRKSACSS